MTSTLEQNRVAKRKHYHANKDQYLERNKKVKAEQRAWLNEVKNVPCMDCGKSYPSYVMDFDHRDPSIKECGITRLVGNSWTKLRKEVAKCDVVCANCHRERTWGYP